jgi:tRNA (guanine37-N1)-methyltransferase
VSLNLCWLLAQPLEAVCEKLEKVEPPTSYVLIGPIAIISLDERVKGREREVAERLLRIPGIRAVYGKSETVGEYRVQRLVHLAGEEFENVTYREHGLEIIIPLGKVYINPRLATEHKRIAELTKNDDTVLDMFAGWGGFSLTISLHGKAKLIVANDLNPWAIKTLIDAIGRNRKKLKTPIVPIMADAAQLPEILAPVFTRIIMNLPHNAVDYLPTAYKLCNPTRECVIHVYVIAGSEEDARRKVLDKVTSETTLIRAQRVLDYAPHKYIYRVDLKRLPR